MITEIVLTAGYALLCCYVLSRWRFTQFNGLSKWVVPSIFLLKFCVGLTLFLIYSIHYEYRNESDAFRYFDDAMVIYPSLWEDPSHFFRFLFGIDLDAPEMTTYFERMGSWKSSYNYGITNDNPTIIRLNLVVSLFSFGYYQVHTVFFCMLSTIGGVAIFRSLGRFFSFRMALMVIAFALPTVIFWSSGVLKEAPLILALGLLIYSFCEMVFAKFRTKLLVLFVLAFFTLVFLKEYVLISLITPLLFLLVARFMGWKRIWISFMVVHLLAGMVAMNARVFYPPGDLLYILQKKQTDFYNVASEKEAGSLIEIPEVGEPIDFFIQAPGALYRSYLRPDLRELDSAFHVACWLESLLLIASIILVVFTFKMPPPRMLAMALYCLSFAIILGLIIGNTVPVLGAVVRYKLPALPFLFAGILLFSRYFQKSTDDQTS